MYEGFIRVAAATPTIRVADCEYNAKAILALIEKANAENVNILCLPELCISGYTCGDLFMQEALLDAAMEALKFLLEKSAAYNVLVVAGLPLACNGKLYNVAAVFCRGKLLGFVPKTNLPNYGEFYEFRQFTPAPEYTQTINEIPFGTDLLFQFEGFSLAVEICEDLWAPIPPSSRHAAAGATIIANLSASNETTGKADYRRSLVAGQSARLTCAYIYANAGKGESTGDMAFSGHNLIYENGILLKESPPFGEAWAMTEIDLVALTHDRRQINTFSAKQKYTEIPSKLEYNCNALSRAISANPFALSDEEKEIVLNIQASGLAKRVGHVGSQLMVIGVSGGLDSTLALLVAVRAKKMLNADILAVTIPCFGTSERSKNNAHRLCEALGINCREIDITESVSRHLEEIGHSGEADVIYENAQARMRTLTLMGFGGIMVGSGCLSELALGYTTYNGDHMSMYSVNAGLPKTQVRQLVKYTADKFPELKAVLTDILTSPVSPELLPTSQPTEDIVGPYELHDFFIYHLMRWGRRPRAVYRLACVAFAGKYPPDVILKWQKLFYRRFFSQQFKRSCLPDGPQTGQVSLSPRGSWRMPSDAMCSVWLAELEEIIK